MVKSGRFSADEILAIADEQEATPMDRQLLVQQFGAAARWPEAEYTRYGVDAERRASIIAPFAAWATDLGNAS